MDPSAIAELCSNPVGDHHQSNNFPVAASFPQQASVDKNDALQQNPQQITYWLIPNLPILEKKVVTASVDFVKNFQILTLKTTDNPNFGIFHNHNDNPEPLDLSFLRNDCQTVTMKDTDSTTGSPNLENVDFANDQAEKLNDSNFENLDLANHRHQSEDDGDSVNSNDLNYGNADFTGPTFLTMTTS